MGTETVSGQIDRRTQVGEHAQADLPTYPTSTARCFPHYIYLLFTLKGLRKQRCTFQWG